MRMMWRVLLLAAVCAVTGLAAGPGQSRASSEGPPLNRVMREKLFESQKILEAVVTSDWVALENHSRELERLTGDPRWTILKYPEYARHSDAFRRAVSGLRQAAAAHDLEETPSAYVSVTLRCVDCHRYLARARMAR
jgi:hypothetical protein